jgi:hypothetical protein
MVAEQGTLKTSITFDKDGKAISIMVNGIGVGSSTICGNSIQLGDTTDSVKTACGTPSFVNKQEASATPGSPGSTKVTEFTYEGNTTVKLIFQNGKLTDKQ